MFDDISITGITPLDYYPCNCSKRNCKQNSKYVKFNIPCQKPDIESINDIKVSICIDDYKIIKTILGFKFVINLYCKIKVVYTALNEEQSVHSAHCSINFCDFMLCENNYICSCANSNLDLFLGLEDVYIYDFDARTIELSLLYIICNISNSTMSYNDHKISNCNDYNCKSDYESSSNYNYSSKSDYESSSNYDYSSKSDYESTSNHNCSSKTNNGIYRNYTCKSDKKKYNSTLSSSKKNNDDTYYCPIEYYDSSNKK